jgi:lysophospholipase L1-like esterase
MTCSTAVNALWVRMFRPLQVEAIGDSLTLGTGSTNGVGWRKLIYDWWQTHPTGSAYDVPYYLGPSIDTGVFLRSSHWGVSGQNIVDVTNGAAVNIGRRAATVDIIPPDIFVIMIGLNDARNNPGPYAGALTRYGTMLSAIDALFPGREYVVTTISDCDPAQAATLANINDFNSGVAAVWAASGLSVHTWDAFAAVPYGAGADYSDQFHWNDAGYAKAALAMQPAIEAALCAARQNA